MCKKRLEICQCRLFCVTASLDSDAGEIQYDQESLEMMSSNVLLVGLCSFFAAILIVTGFYLFLRMSEWFLSFSCKVKRWMGLLCFREHSRKFAHWVWIGNDET